MRGVKPDTLGGFVRSRATRLQRACVWLGLAWACAGLSLTIAADRPAFEEAEPAEVVDAPYLRPKAQSPLSRIPTEPLKKVVIEGNTTISPEEIERKIRSRPGRVPNALQLREDVKALYATKWFLTVETHFRETEEGPVLVFRVYERPILRQVSYNGNKQIKLKELESLTGLKPGSAFDVGTNKEAMRRMEAHYRDKGFLFAKVSLSKGDKKDDREVTFEIKEGPKVHVDSIKFIGNNSFPSGLLDGKLKTKTRMLWLLGGTYDPSTVNDDLAALKEYYHGLGYFDAKVTCKERFSANKSSLTLEYHIDEGVRYKVRNVQFVGNRVITQRKLRENLKLKEGDFFNERFLRVDVDKLTGQYGELGRIFAKIDAQPRFLEEPGTMDLVVQIKEDKPYRIRRIPVSIEGDHPHTRESVVINMLKFRPGDLANPRLIKQAQRGLGGQIFERKPEAAPQINVVRVEREDKSLDRALVRFQSPDSDPNAPGIGPSGEVYNPGMYDRAVNGQPMNPDDEVGEVDIPIRVTEAQTGSLMFGVGVNSNSGLVGNMVLQENNFDITRFPNSFQDIVDGVAFRGNGQQFRLEAVPGTQVSRYLISWRDPHFLDQDYSLGVSGYYFDRQYQSWTERRAGGRISVGKQLNPEWSLTGALRLEDVTISNLPLFPPPDLLAVQGSNLLSTARVSIAHDTRDSPFLPGNGHFVEASFEQAFGDFSYSRAEIDGRQYFTLMERPDGTNRHILFLSGNLGWSGNDTPVFERFYAGGYQSFRGFAFRGVSPEENGVKTGGFFQALGTAEYEIPILANDMLQAVVFTDVGTVDQDVTFDKFRVAVGGGLRITIPALGPAPLAIDFAVPLIDQTTDDRQLISFSFGVTR